MVNARPNVAATAGCGLLLLAYAAVAWSVVSGESPTYDEPYHAVSAWVQLHRHDYRLDNEDPPLWQYWASLPNGPSALRADFADPRWRHMRSAVGGQWGWATDTLYRTPGNDPATFVRRCRAMMLAVAVGLGAAIAAWAWRLGGPTAAVVATALFCGDPTCLGHGPLMKNDCAAALAWVGVAWSLWAVGRRATAASVAALAVAAAAAVLVKFSGLLVVVLVPAGLLARVAMGEAWPVFGRPVVGRGRRLAVAITIAAVVAAVGYAGVWAAYGFRFRSGPAAGDHLDMAPLVGRATDNTGGAVPVPVRAAVFAADHHLVPEAFAAGFTFTYAESLVRPAYLLGAVSLTGWWYYFPFAMLVKTPVATIVAIGATVTLARRAWRRQPWATASLALPIAVYLASAMTTHLNIGLRHVLPVYPVLFVAVGCGAAAAMRRRPGRVIVGVLAAGLAVEAAAAYPHYISFFNAPAAAAGRGGYDLLADSNLDWGQGLIALRTWQQSHGGEPLYLSYFGLADPRAFGLRYVPLPTRSRADPGTPARFPDPARPCWVAISVTHLQEAVLQPPGLRPFYQRWAGRRPTAVVGGSIYVFRYDPLAEIGRVPARPDR